MATSYINVVDYQNQAIAMDTMYVLSFMTFYHSLDSCYHHWNQDTQLFQFYFLILLFNSHSYLPPLHYPWNLETTNLFSISTISQFRELYKWNHTVCELLTLAFYFHSAQCFWYSSMLSHVLRVCSTKITLVTACYSSFNLSPNLLAILYFSELSIICFSMSLQNFSCNLWEFVRALLHLGQHQNFTVS